jgi:hypothetical protein
LDLKIDKRNLKKSAVDENELIARISTGKAILFTGAGFSKSTRDVGSNEPSLAKELAHDICHLGEFPEDDDLRYATDYYLDNCDKLKLIELLKEKYTLQSTSDVHETICSANWRRFYTTNYDKSIEMAAAQVGKVIECIDTSFPTEKYYKRNGLCVHLNGSIDSLDEDTLETSFKLSTSSYISPDSFVNSDWNYYFKKDLERSSAIVFVGYSMYDIEIQKILFSSKSLSEKTYFITRENPDRKSEFTLSKFGNVLPIGVEGFAHLISSSKEALDDYDGGDNLQAIAKYELSPSEYKIRDSDVEAMIMYGHISNELIDNGVISSQRIPHLILRDHLDSIKKFIQNGRNVVIYGDMGNGKSIMLRELQAYLSTSSIESFYIADIEGDYIGDIDLIAKSGKRSAIHVDGYERHIDLITHFSGSLPDNISIIATSRTAEHERLKSELHSLGFEYNEICVDSLSANESTSLVEIIDNLGVWGDRAGLSADGKQRYIDQKHLSQISLTLLSLFNSPQIRDRISSALQGLVTDQETKDTIFSIAFIEILDMPCKFSLISDVADNDKIYSSELQQNQSFKDLFHVNGLEINTKSSLFCLSLVRNHFSPTYVTSQLQKIAQYFNSYSKRDYEQSVIFKSTLRFSFVERLISDENKKGNLRRYYEDLKISVPWLKSDPHFWLQYGMANITFKEYTKAQQYLDQSYSLARKKDQYHTDSIDAQQARLHILLAMGGKDPSEIYSAFSKAHSLLDRLDNDVYKFRQVEKYKDFHDACYHLLSKGNKVNFQRASQKMRQEIDNSVDSGEIDASQQQSIKRAKQNLDYIINSISAKN